MNWIVQFDVWFSDHDPDAYSRLLPGLTQEVCAKAERQIGLDLPPSWHGLYQWRNGQSAEMDDVLYRSFRMMPISEVLEVVDYMRQDAHDGVYGDPDWWKDSWVPFLADLSGDFLYLDIERGGSVAWFLHDLPERMELFPSLDAWGERAIEGILEYEAEGHASDEYRRLIDPLGNP
jgi:cell wall assembly regulator SMI1